MNLTGQTIMRWSAGVLIAAVVCAAMWFFRSVVVYILISAVLAIIGRPLVRRLSLVNIKRHFLPRWAAALITLVLMWCIVASLFALIVPLVAGKIYELSSLDLRAVLLGVQEPLERMQEYLHTVFALPQGQISLSDIIVATMRRVLNYDTINTAFSSIIDVGLSSVIVLFSVSFITFFFLKEDGLFYSMVISVFPERFSENVTRSMDKITYLLSRYFTGLLTESLILMTIISIVMLCFGMSFENACFIGVIMGAMNVIPYAGPAIGGLVAMFIGIVSPIDGYTIGHTVAIIVGVLLTVKAIDDFIIQPTLYSSRVSAHPLEVFIVILMAGSVGGIVGMFVAIPSYTVLRVFAKEFFSEVSLVRKLTQQV